MQITDVIPDDLADVLRLNQSSVPHVSGIDLAQMQWFADHAHYFRVVRQDGLLAGFLIGLRPGLPYESPNYRWFGKRYRDFGYVDRVAVAPSARRRGVASRLYQDFATTLGRDVGVMTCEVNIRPANDSSMRYHEQLGFVRVGSQETEGGKKEVALLEMKF
ncbi:MAG: GNAT family N-acetyltransferase [Gammaproteobacteria bacterium]|nr:GNAT family N-acetyltransferase [Gammaproteobacteria bacterium]MBU2676107.1 GNAT family N-acetyltransferase [Gammaproteobacteria bacterium]NNC56345.1 GNAT family N-acetyltransferase [Woeseiaceae bacterium]NNL49843.1 GNAT family N-acetyltransferase [Woeseiaceae bacterium]